jgi:hypothetical protein
VFVYALRHKAISANPVDGVDFSGNSAQRRNRRHYPLTAEQVAAVAASVGERYPVCELLTLFAAYTGLRAEGIAGCEVGDLVFIAASTGPRAHIDVRRAKKRRAGEWVTDTLKTAKSKRTVPLPGWLAERMRDYLDNTHPAADTPSASVAEPSAWRCATPGLSSGRTVGLLGAGRLRCVLQERVTPGLGSCWVTGEPTGRQKCTRRARGAAVESVRGAVPVLPRARFPGPLAAPGVRVSTHRALHGSCRQAGLGIGQGVGILLPR